jgi:hypothetical protein
VARQLFVLVLIALVVAAAGLAVGPRPDRFRTTAQASGCVTAPSGLVSWWPGDGNAYDIISTNNGALQNGASFGSGMVGQAFNFDGVDDFVQAPTSGLPIGSSDRTIELWAKVDTFVSGESFFVGYGFGPSGQAITPLDLGTEDQQHRIFFSTWGPAIFGPSVGTGTWHHVAVTSLGGTQTLYLDGASVASGTLTMNTSAGTSLYLGQIPVDNKRRLQGQVDEVTVYDRALSAQEVQTIANAGSAGKCHPPLTMPDFKQYDDAWNPFGGTYGGGDDPCRYPNPVTGPYRCTIATHGCLLSAVADVLNYWGVSTDPLTLNDAMVAAGWRDGNMDSEKVISYSHLSVSPTKGYDTSAVIQYLSKHIPVIVGLPIGGPYREHWVVLTGQAPGNDFYILDPNDPGSGLTLLGKYPTASQWTETWIINGGASVGAEERSPVAMLLTDPLGRRTGYDPSTGTIVNEIPDSAYGVMGAIENDVTNTDGTPGLVSVYTNAPIPGTYTLQITGTGTGPYHVDAWSSTADGALTSSSSQGNATPGSSTSITVNVQGSSVGGIAELPHLSDSPLGAESSEKHGGLWVQLGILAAAILVVTGTLAWHARRRWLK